MDFLLMLFGIFAIRDWLMEKQGCNEALVVPRMIPRRGRRARRRLEARRLKMAREKAASGTGFWPWLLLALFGVTCWLQPWLLLVAAILVVGLFVLACLKR
jgi:hypothetical protein